MIFFLLFLSRVDRFSIYNDFDVFMLSMDDLLLLACDFFAVLFYPTVFFLILFALVLPVLLAFGCTYYYSSFSFYFSKDYEFTSYE